MRLLRGKTASLFIGIITLFTASVAGAQGGGELPPWYVGGFVGYNGVSSGIGGGLGFGVELGYEFARPWGAGLFLKSGNHDNGITSFMFGAEALYQLDMLLPGLMAAGDIASVKFSGGGYDGNYDLGLGARIAYDAPIAGNMPFTVGGQLGLLFTQPINDWVTVFHALVGVKFFF